MISWPALGQRVLAWGRRWLGNWRSHTLTMLLVLAIALGVNAWQTRDVPAGPAPEFQAPLAGAPQDTQLALSQWRARHAGRAVALHFWADWCPICRMEEGSITAVQQDWPVLAVAMRSGTPGHVAGVLQQRGLPWASVTDPDGRIAARYGLKAVPAFVVIDADGRIRHAAVGYTTEAGMRLRLWLAQHF